MGISVTGGFVERLSIFKTIPPCLKFKVKIQNKTRINVIHACVQGDSEGKVNILGGDKFGHCEKMLQWKCL
jgi:hypothetical protein